MGYAPDRCPQCGGNYLHEVDTQRKGFCVGKAIGGAVLLGPVGLLAGALGKKKSLYICRNCGFQHEYDG